MPSDLWQPCLDRFAEAAVALGASRVEVTLERSSYDSLLLRAATEWRMVPSEARADEVIYRGVVVLKPAGGPV